MLRWKSSLKPTSGGGGGASLASDVLLYVPFTDADGSTTADGYVKSGGTHPLTSDVFTRSGNAVINTDQTKMTGSSTAAYNPAGANSDGWELDSTISSGLEVGSSSPLSIQFWFYCSNDGSGSSARLLGWDGWHTSGSGIEFETLSTDYDRFIFYEHTGATTSRRSIGDHVLNANAWNHIYWAFQPSGSSYLGINGTVTEASGSYITNFAPTVDLNLLKTPGNADDAVKGYVQEFIVKNTVPYTANFTPSTTPLVSSGGSGITLENQASNSGHSGYSSPRDMSVNYPAVSANDIMLMIVVTATTTNLTSSPPTGWTKVLEIDSYSTIGIYWKLATSSATATSGTWDDVFASNEDYYVWVGAYSGCDTTAPVDASNSQGHTGYNTAWSISITTQTNNAMIVTAFGRNKDDKTATFSDGTQVVSTYFRNEGYININEKIEATAGSHTRSATFSGNARGAKAAIALKPA